MITDNKIIFHYEYIKEKKPITADIFLTNYCNNKCKYCSYNRWDLSKNNKSMSLEEFKRNYEILKRMGVKGIILTGGGEPSVCKDFDKITEWLEEQNINYGINTNFNILKYIKPIFLKISLDGYNSESYKNTRGVDTYDIVLSNLKKYIDWKKNNNVKTQIVLQCMSDSVQTVEKFYNSIKIYDVQSIVFRPIESTCGSYYNDENELDKAKQISEYINNLKKSDSRVCLNYKFSYLKSIFSECYANSLQIALNENSEVVYCCHKPYEIIGHITDENILEKKNNFKTNISLCDVPCRLSGPNKCFIKLSELEKSIDINFI